MLTGQFYALKERIEEMTTEEAHEFIKKAAISDSDYERYMWLYEKHPKLLIEDLLSNIYLIHDTWTLNREEILANTNERFGATGNASPEDTGIKREILL